METITRRVIKRNGEEVVFDVQKILNAIRKANNEVEPIHRLNEYQIEAVGKIVMDQISQSNHATAVEDIQDMVERGIMEMRTDIREIWQERLTQLMMEYSHLLIRSMKR